MKTCHFPCIILAMFLVWSCGYSVAEISNDVDANTLYAGLLSEEAVYKYECTVQRYEWEPSIGTMQMDLFSVHDIDNDGIDELFIACGTEDAPTAFAIIKYENEALTCVDYFTVNWKHPSVYIVNGERIRLLGSGTSGYTSYEYYLIGEDDLICAETYLGQSGDEYYLNGQEVDEHEFAKYSLYSEEIPEETAGFILTKTLVEFYPNTPQYISEILGVDTHDKVAPMSKFSDLDSIPSNEYICPYSSDIIIEMRSLGVTDHTILKFAKYEILARHGYYFEEKSAFDYFSGKEWYSETMHPGKYPSLNLYEQENIFRIESLLEALPVMTQEPAPSSEIDVRVHPWCASTADYIFYADNDGLMRLDRKANAWSRVLEQQWHLTGDTIVIAGIDAEYLYYVTTTDEDSHYDGWPICKLSRMSVRTGETQRLVDRIYGTATYWCDRLYYHDTPESVMSCSRDGSELKLYDGGWIYIDASGYGVESFRNDQLCRAKFDEDQLLLVRDQDEEGTVGSAQILSGDEHYYMMSLSDFPYLFLELDDLNRTAHPVCEIDYNGEYPTPFIAGDWAFFYDDVAGYGIYFNQYVGKCHLSDRNTYIKAEMLIFPDSAY